MNKQSIIWNPGSCLSNKQLQQYLHQQIDKDELRMIEMHITDCPLCSDAIDALMAVPDSPQLVESIHDAIDKKVKTLQAEEQKKVKPHLTVTSKNIKKEKQKNYKWIWAAASLFVFALGAYSIYYTAYTPQTKNETAQVKNTIEQKEYNRKDEPSSQELSTLQVPIDSFARGTESKPKEAEIATNTQIEKSKIAPPMLTSNKNITTLPNPEKVTTSVTQRDISEPIKDVYTAPPTDKSEIAAIPEPKAKEMSAEEELVKEQVVRQVEAKKPIEKSSSNGYGLSNKSKKALTTSPASNQLSYTQEIASNNDNASSYNEIQGLSNKQLGQQFFDEQNYSQAEKYLVKALRESNPKDQLELELLLAKCYLKQGKNKKATKLLEKLKQTAEYQSEAEKLLSK
ncbi:MAG: tetratricopeptide repeat protein [Chitinophagaceae bacterium]